MHLDRIYGDPFEVETAYGKLQSLKMESGAVNQLQKFRTYRDDFLRLVAESGRAAPSNDMVNIYSFTQGIPQYLAKKVADHLRDEHDFQRYVFGVEALVRSNASVRIFDR